MTPCVYSMLALGGALRFNGALQVLDFWLLPVLAPVVVVAVVFFYVNSRPLRRQESARFLLDLIESAIQQGQPVERHIISLAHSKDAAPGVGFHLLAARLEKGYGLIPALERTPHWLPPQVTAMLKVGESLGDLTRVLPACRRLLEDGTSQTRALINYQVAFAFILNPLVICLLPVFSAKIMPVLRDVARSVRLDSPGLFSHVSEWMPVLFAMQLVLTILCFCAAIFLLGGTRFVSWLESGVLPLGKASDWLFLRVPWRRKRLQRDFSAMLGLMLDAGVPEEQAVLMAARGTANGVFLRRAESAAEQLRQGATLTEAVQLLDESGELRWRLANGKHGAGGFFSALQGWNESLEARAFQQEQAAAHTISTSLVLLNAVTVALVAAGVMQLITQLGNSSYLFK